MSDDVDLGQELFGSRRETRPTEYTSVVVTGVAKSDSDNGLVTVDLGGTTVAGVDGTAAIEMATEVSVKVGDTVSVTISGARAKTPVVTGVVGRGDEQQAAIDAAQETADTATSKADTAQAQADAAKEAAAANETALEAFKADASNTFATKVEVQQSESDLSASVSSTYATKTTVQAVSDAVSAAQSTADTATSKADAAQTSANTNATDLANYVTSNGAKINDLQSQIDGSIQTWFFEVAPSDTTEPTSEWTTIALKNNHLGDLYYDTITGYCYRYQVANNVYGWTRITDVDVTKALADAAKAQDTADHKRRVFVSTPTTPYDVGDLWVSTDLMRCSTAKTSAQSYDAADWTVAALNATVTEGYATKTELSATDSSLQAKVTDSYSRSTQYTDGKISTEVTNRNAAITAKANEITSSVSSTYATKSAAASVIPFIQGTQTAVTGTWTGAAPFASLVDGQQISYWLPYSGSGNATLNLTLSDGTTTGAVDCYYGGPNRLTTHYQAGSIIQMVYRSNVSINGSATKYTGWWAKANYVDGNEFVNQSYGGRIKIASAVTAGRLVVGSDSGYFHLGASVSFDSTLPVLWSNISYAAGVSVDATWGFFVKRSDVLLTSTYSAFTGVSQAPVFLKGTLSGKTFTVASSNYITCAVPTSDDGFTYMYLGSCTYSASTTAMNYLCLESSHPFYKFDAHSPAGFKSFEQIIVETQSRVTQTESGITSLVEETTQVHDLVFADLDGDAFSSQTGAFSAYANVKLSLKTRVEQTAKSLLTTIFDKDNLMTYIRESTLGVEVGKLGAGIKALVSSAGAFEVQSEDGTESYASLSKSGQRNGLASGYHTMSDSAGFHVYSGGTELGLFNGSSASVGNSSSGNVYVDDSSMQIRIGSNVLCKIDRDSSLPWDASPLRLSAPSNQTTISVEIEGGINVLGGLYVNGVKKF